MNILSIKREYRTLGGGYGMPMWHIDCGGYNNMDWVALLEKLRQQGFNVGQWVVLRNALGEKGTGTFCEGLKACKAHVEIECRGNQKTPTWFTTPDRWLIYWEEKGEFNYGALRTRQDMLLYDGYDIKEWLDMTEKVGALRALVVGNPDSIWEKVKDRTNLRVYKKC